MLTIWAMPVHLPGIVTYKVLEVEKHCSQTIKLVSQPEISEPNMVEGRRHYSELKYGQCECITSNVKV